MQFFYLVLGGLATYRLSLFISKEDGYLGILNMKTVKAKVSKLDEPFIKVHSATLELLTPIN